MKAWRQISCSLLVYLAGAECTLSQNDNPVPTIDTILTRMVRARMDNRATLRPYSVTRDYSLFGKERQATKSQVIVAVSFTPPDVKHYSIQQANGMGLGERIVRQMLDHETDVVKNYGSTDLSRANYDFRLLGEEELKGARCYVLETHPKRKDKNLLRGKIWVDTKTYLLHRTEGEPARVPSWWLRDVHIALAYGSVGGMWLQTSSESTSNVRLLGQYTMVSRDLEYKFSELASGRVNAVSR